MQPVTASHPSPAGVPGGLVIGLVASGQERLRAALRRVAAAPELLAVTARIVVVDAGRTPSATVLREAVRLPSGLLDVVRRPDVGRAEALARALAEAIDEPRAGWVLLLDDVALTQPDLLLTAFETARCSPSAEVVGLRDPSAVEAGPASWWGAVLPLDAIRAIGSTLPEAGEQALADLVLRADAAGFRSTVLEAPGPVPRRDADGAILLALLHAPVSARTPVLAAALAAELRAGRAPSLLRSLRLWLAWPRLRATQRIGALDRASIESWAARVSASDMDERLPRGEQEEAENRPAGIRSHAWPTTKRVTSAA